MLVSHSKKFVFFHLYKVAGTSVKRALNPYKEAKGRPHTKPSEIKDKNLLNYFKFCFVRNPWDWQVSLYFYMLLKKNHRQHALIKSMNFEQYIEWRVNYECFTQYEWLSENGNLSGNIDIDFIGKYEFLNSDFNKICDILKIGCSLPYKNKTNHKHYTEYYTEKSKKIIEKAFKKDINFFGYSFKNKNLISGEEVYNG